MALDFDAVFVRERGEVVDGYFGAAGLEELVGEGVGEGERYLDVDILEVADDGGARGVDCYGARRKVVDGVGLVVDFVVGHGGSEGW